MGGEGGGGGGGWGRGCGKMAPFRSTVDFLKYSHPPQGINVTLSKITSPLGVKCTHR